MSISTRKHMMGASHGILAVEESGEGDIPVLCIHGNSFWRGVFRNQVQGQIAKHHRLIAFDLPGHGQSSNAPGPHRSYTRSGLADAAVELLDKLGMSEATVASPMESGSRHCRMEAHRHADSSFRLCRLPNPHFPCMDDVVRVEHGKIVQWSDYYAHTSSWRTGLAPLFTENAGSSEYEPNTNYDED